MPEEIAVADLKVDEVLDVVGDDKELAQSALEAEQASENPRSTLVQGLEAILEAGDEPEESGDSPEPDAGGDSEQDEPSEPEDSVVEEPEEEDVEEQQNAPAARAVPSSPQSRMVAGAEALARTKDKALRRNLGLEVDEDE